jgi:hypothetical protein
MCELFNLLPVHADFAIPVTGAVTSLTGAVCPEVLLILTLVHACDNVITACGGFRLV